jgi:hypothetical protein
MDGDRSPTLDDEHRAAIKRLESKVESMPLFHRIDVKLLLDAVQRLERRDDLMRAQLKAEQRKRRHHR